MLELDRWEAVGLVDHKMSYDLTAEANNRIYDKTVFLNFIEFTGTAKTSFIGWEVPAKLKLSLGG